MIMMRPKMLCRLNKKHHELENLLKYNHMIKRENPFEKVKEKLLSLFFAIVLRGELRGEPKSVSQDNLFSMEIY